MAHVVEIETKEMVDFPAYVMCFLGIIMKKLEFYGLIDGKPNKLNEEPPSTLIIPIVSRNYKYCYEGISLVEKTIKRRGFDCKMSHYKIEDINEKDGTKTQGYSYEYKITKSK